MKAWIKNVNIVTPTGVLPSSGCLIEGGYISYIGTQPQRADEVFDGKGGYLLPGFIDLHCHGGQGYDFMDATPEEMLQIAEFHLRHGTTSLFATTMTESWSNIESALESYKTLWERGTLSTLSGVHLEGPWFSPAQCGAQNPSNMELPSKERVNALLEKYPFIRRISLAPELEGAMEAGAYAAERGLVVSAGHTDADFDTVVKASENGYTLLTHFYSGMSGVVRKNLYRVAGAVEAGYYLDGMCVEIIADGKHLPSSLLKLVYKIKGADGICLITDGTRGSGLAEGEAFKLGRRDSGVDCIVEEGVAKLLDKSSFGGSVATFDRLFKTALASGADIVEVSKTASGTPARIMGLDELGSIELGKAANLLLMNEKYEIIKIFLKGEEIR